MTAISPKKDKLIESKPKVWTLPQVILMLVILLFSLTCLLPFVNVAAVSFSSKSAILRGDVSFWPVEFETTAYSAIFSDPSMIHSLVFTVEITVGYTLFSMILTILMAYPLTKKRLHGRKFFNFLALFTMYFSGGTIPIYLNIKELGLLDSPWALILPGMISSWNIFLLRNFMSDIPDSIMESAKLDGANDFLIYVKLYLPLSKAGLATIGLFTALGYWNSWSGAMLYINSADKYPLQYLLYSMLSNIQGAKEMAAASGVVMPDLPGETYKMAMAMVTTGPILLLYPFVQRYFVKGITVGAVKG